MLEVREKEATQVQNREFNLIVNGRRKDWSHEVISFDQVVELAFPSNPANTNTIYTVTYKHGPKENREGIMVQGDSVYVKSGMNFNVTATGQS